MPYVPWCFAVQAKNCPIRFVIARFCWYEDV
jgi:hypothetical protein